jgi:regulatory protein
MVVTKIEKFDKKYKVYIEDEYYFSLYHIEVKRYTLKVDEEIDGETIDKIVDNIILKRGKNYLYYLIAKKDYTCNELRTKLLKADYRQDYAELILNTVKKLDLINDQRYANQYVLYKSNRKSRYEMMNKLRVKGIDQEIIQHSFEVNDINEYEAAKKYLDKKMNRKSTYTNLDKEKMYRSLYRKGFNFETIKSVLNAYNFVNN